MFKHYVGKNCQGGEGDVWTESISPDQGSLTQPYHGCLYGILNFIEKHKSHSLKPSFVLCNKM